jgi:hypothetical protein
MSSSRRRADRLAKLEFDPERQVFMLSKPILGLPYPFDWGSFHPAAARTAIRSTCS